MLIDGFINSLIISLIGGFFNLLIAFSTRSRVWLIFLQRLQSFRGFGPPNLFKLIKLYYSTPGDERAVFLLLCGKI